MLPCAYRHRLRESDLKRAALAGVGGDVHGVRSALMVGRLFLALPRVVRIDFENPSVEPSVYLRFSKAKEPEVMAAQGKLVRVRSSRLGRLESLDVVVHPKR